MVEIGMVESTKSGMGRGVYNIRVVGGVIQNQGGCRYAQNQEGWRCPQQTKQLEVSVEGVQQRDKVTGRNGRTFSEYA